MIDKTLDESKSTTVSAYCTGNRGVMLWFGLYGSAVGKFLRHPSLTKSLPSWLVDVHNVLSRDFMSEIS
jgi:hypothetical protein